MGNFRNQVRESLGCSGDSILLRLSGDTDAGQKAVDEPHPPPGPEVGEQSREPSQVDATKRSCAGRWPWSMAFTGAALFAQPGTNCPMSSLPLSDDHSTDHLRGIFLSLTSVLVGFGLLMVYSASITSWPTEHEQVYLIRHAVYLGIAAGLAVLCSRIPPAIWYRAAPLLFWSTVVLLALVLVPGIGTRVNGAQRWLRYGPVSLQPSELAKITLVLYLCRLIEQRRHQLTHWWHGTVPFAIPVAIVLPLVLKEPDLGTSVFLLLGAGLALFLGGWPVGRFLIAGGLGLPAAAFLFALKPYQWQRITGFFATWRDINEAPYQIKQSLLSLGSGGISGIGLGRGWQKLSFLPEANTDFVFAVVGEELGLIGTVSVVVLWLGVYFAGRRLIAPLPRGSFAQTLSLTLLTQLIFQAALNMAVVTSLVPPKGIPHPLLSYGGNSLVTSLMSIGIIVSLTRSPRSADEFSSVSPVDL